MKLSYNSPTPFLPSTKFYLNILGSSYLRYLLKSLVRTINFNFFFYLIDEALVPPKFKLTPKLIESRIRRRLKSSKRSSSCFIPLNHLQVTNLLPKYNPRYRRNIDFRTRSLTTALNFSAKKVHTKIHPSSKWLMPSLLTTTSYPLLGTAKIKHNVVKSTSKMFALLKSNRLQKRLSRPLTVKYTPKPMLSFKLRKLLLFKNFISSSTTSSGNVDKVPLYKSIRFKRRSKLFRSRTSPYFFLNWNRAPKISSASRIDSIWTRFKSLSRFNVYTSRLTRTLSSGTNNKSKINSFKSLIRRQVIIKAKRGKKVWSRRVRRLVLRLRLNKRFWATRSQVAKAKYNFRQGSTQDLFSLPKFSHKKGTSLLDKFTDTLNPKRKRRFNRSLSEVKFDTTFHRKPFLLKPKKYNRFKNFLKSLSSKLLVTRIASISRRVRTYFDTPKVYGYTPRLRVPALRSRKVQVPVAYNVKTRSSSSYRKFKSHGKFILSFRRSKKKVFKGPRRTRRLVVHKSKKLFSSRWSNWRFRLFRPVIWKRNHALTFVHTQKFDSDLLIDLYRSLSTLLAFQTFSSIFNNTVRATYATKLPQLLPRILLAPTTANTPFLINSNKKPTLRFSPDSSLFFVTSPFFFLNYITALPNGLSDSIRSTKLTSRLRNFTVFPDSDSVKALFFRYVNRQKALAQSRKSFYRAFVKRRSYRATKLLKSNIRLFDVNSRGYSNKLIKGKTKTTKWIRLKKLHILPRRVKNAAINRIRRIRFKPGYGRIWRSARVSVKDILGINVKYQYRLTPILQKQYLYSRNEKIEHLSFTLGYALLSAKFAHDTWVLNSLISNSNVYLNGVVCNNEKTRIFTNDFIQLIVNLKYYISMRWLKNWTFRKRNKISKIFYKKIRPGITRGVTKTPKLSRNLPNYFFNLKYCYSDVPRCFEVDYFSLSLFVIHDQLRFERYLPRQQFRINYFTLNMYNWKYIT